jgi:LPS-assembly lipoprotein
MNQESNESENMMTTRRTFGAVALASLLTLSGCGFHLRGSNGDADLPFKTLYLGVAETSTLGAELKRNIRASGNTTIVSDPKLADARLEVLTETRDRVVQSLNSQGRIREYTLYYRLTFRVLGKADAVLLPPTEIVLKRDISFNESQVLAKESEEGLLYRDMQSDLVQQIMRRLAAIKPA